MTKKCEFADDDCGQPYNRPEKLYKTVAISRLSLKTIVNFWKAKPFSCPVGITINRVKWSERLPEGFPVLVARRPEKVCFNHYLGHQYGLWAIRYKNKESFLTPESKEEENFFYVTDASAFGDKDPIDVLYRNWQEKPDKKSSIEAPWSNDLVTELNLQQLDPACHPHTCGKDSNHPPLIATNDGWICEKCDYVQSWGFANSKQT